MAAVFATSVFALPNAGNFKLEFDEDASVTELTDSEIVAVDGEGVAGAVAGAIVGGVLGGVWCCVRETARIITNSPKANKEPASFARTLIDDMVGGAVTGAITGALSPTP